MLMDKSKLPGLTKKSSETPWTPTHERKKLSNRAGTVYGKPSGLVYGSRKKVRSWVDKDKPEADRQARLNEENSFFKAGVDEGQMPTDKKPVKRTHGGLVYRSKKKGEESEY
jgi:hypothetical protein